LVGKRTRARGAGAPPDHSSSKALRAGAAAGGCLLLGACGFAGPLSALDPAGPGAAPIARVWWVMCIAALALLALMTSLGLYAALRRRHQPARVSPRALLVGGGLVLPVTALTALLVWGVGAGHALLPLAAAGPVFVVEVTARQWMWAARYPDHPQAVTEPNRIDIPAGRPVDVRVRTDDVIHSFWVPRLGGKIDAIPGRVNVLRLRADAPGIYRGVCSEFCGTGHPAMGFEVHAHAPEELTARLGAPR
jgi:cytochrome c oxidase subunit 2